MKWNVNVGVRLSIDYDDIEADTEEEAREIAIDQAREDIEFNNCECSDDYTVYACWTNDKEDKE